MDARAVSTSRDDDWAGGPIYARLKAVRQADLPRTHKAVLQVLVGYADEQGRCWPATETIAQAAGVKKRAAQLALQDLDEVGIVVVEKVGGGRRQGSRVESPEDKHIGRGSLRRIDFTKLGAAGVAVDAPLWAHRALAEIRARLDERIRARTEAAEQGRQRVRGEAIRRMRSTDTAHAQHGYGACAAPNHAIEHPTERAIHGARAKLETEAGTRSPLAVAAMAGMAPSRELRAALEAAGVRGANLDRLAACPGLTVAAVDAVALEAHDDPSVRNPAAVVVRRLATQLGVELRRSPRVSAELQRMRGQLEEIRRRKGVSL